MQRTRVKVPETSGRKDQGEYANFSDFMRRLVAVPHTEIKAKLDAEKKAKQRRKKRTSDRASPAKD
jgi:hypothetical protein